MRVIRLGRYAYTASVKALSAAEILPVRGSGIFYGILAAGDIAGVQNLQYVAEDLRGVFLSFQGDTTAFRDNVAGIFAGCGNDTLACLETTFHGKALPDAVFEHGVHISRKVGVY